MGGGKMERTIAVPELSELLAERNVILLDVRRKGDREADPRVIPSASWQDPQNVEQWGEDLPQSKEVVIYCVRGGSVSNSVLDHLLSRGIRARYLAGGIEAWTGAGRPTEKQRREYMSHGPDPVSR
jgi:rhodanese-related sulfurtransferase